MFGSIIVAWHNVWTGLPLVLTVWGWANVLKAFLYFTFPAVGLRRIQSVSHERAGQIVGGGIFSLLVAGILGYHIWSTA
jgi:hypothetical protein